MLNKPLTYSRHLRFQHKSGAIEESQLSMTIAMLGLTRADDKGPLAVFGDHGGLVSARMSY